MKIPENTRVYENSTSTYWFRDEVLYLVAKKVKQPDLAVIEAETEELKQRMGGRTCCAVIDVGQSRNSSPLVREHNSQQFPRMFRAIAFISQSATSRMLANIYLGTKPFDLPVKMCISEQEAEEWIKNYR